MSNTEDIQLEAYTNRRLDSTGAVQVEIDRNNLMQAFMKDVLDRVDTFLENNK